MVELGYTVDGPKRRKQSPMNMEEIVNKIGRANLKKAVESDDALEGLAKRLRTGLSARGFSFDNKGFLAHMTLMRSADLTSGMLPMPLVARGDIDTVTLFKSDLSGPHPVYTPLHTRFLH